MAKITAFNYEWISIKWLYRLHSCGQNRSGKKHFLNGCNNIVCFEFLDRPNDYCTK